ncbi:uncharacterized protein EDB91DRAFT_1083050 [Suillus paluster]|uniref:uncharacterized protein n=1 Tax=Suillus paluster TaxID=48578 RepID=UPI001B87434F|nr:uncharacterized protein EDB91DRAFT_1083050 [Suillus paluster]KAG1737538.1 hypothetical protein EDB91DRAFT_1083050 [Suillus paluster]
MDVLLDPTQILIAILQVTSNSVLTLEPSIEIVYIPKLLDRHYSCRGCSDGMSANVLQLFIQAHMVVVDLGLAALTNIQSTEDILGAPIAGMILVTYISAVHRVRFSDGGYRRCLPITDASPTNNVDLGPYIVHIDYYPLSRGIMQWDYWGPLDARIFKYHYRFNVTGSRVFWHCLRLTRQLVLTRMRWSHGLGRVVTESSTIEIPKIDKEVGVFPPEAGEQLTTSLPYVQVVSDRKFGSHEVKVIWVDNDRIYLGGGKQPNGWGVDKFSEVIEIRT